MFFRKITLPVRELIPAGVGENRPSGAGAWPPPPAPPAKKRKSAGSSLKIAIAAAILGTGVAAMFSAHGKIISNNAVLATNIVSVRTPIDGTVSGLPDRAGVMVSKGALIAHVENPRVNDERLADLRARQTRVEADLKAARDKRRSPQSPERPHPPDEIHTKVNSERLASLVNEAEKTPGRGFLLRHLCCISCCGPACDRRDRDGNGHRGHAHLL